MYEKALKLAYKHYDLETLKHVERVADRVDTDVEKAVAILHDIVEDTDLEVEDLYDFDDLADEVAHLTRTKAETYREYIHRVVKAGGIALKVKIADLHDHLYGPTPCPGGLAIRYTKALKYIEETKKEY